MQLELIFTGLIAFASPTCPMEDPSQTQAYAVFLQDGAKMHKAELGIFLEYAPAKLVIGSETVIRAPHTSARKIGGKDYLIWSLEGRTIEIDGMPGVSFGYGTRKKKQSGEWEYPDFRGGDGKEHFSWVPELQQACPNGYKTQFKLKELSTKTHTGVQAVASFRIDANAPSRLVPFFDKSNGGEIYTFTNSYSQILSDGAKLDLHLDMNTATVIRLKSIKNPKDVWTIPIQPDDSGKARGDLSNQPPPMPEDPYGIPHFKEYYRILFGKKAAKACSMPKKTALVEAAAPVKCTICSVCGPGL